MDKNRVAHRPAASAWTRIDGYVCALARERRALRSRRAKPRSEPETPRLSLSVLPFVALAVGLAVIMVAVIVAAWPGRETPSPRTPAREMGKAERGWFDAARKEMR